MARRAWLEGGPRRTATGHFVPARARLPPLFGRGGRLDVGAYARVRSIHHQGAVVLHRGAQVLRIDGGHEVVVGPRARVPAGVSARGRVVVLDGAEVGDIDAGGDVMLLGSCKVGAVRAGGDILVDGEPRTGILQPKGRVTAPGWAR